MQNIYFPDNGYKFQSSGGLATTCGSAHYIAWAGDPNYEIPEGTPCACGMMQWHKEKCHCCGSVVSKLIPR